MFEALEDQMKIDGQKATTKRERLIRCALIVVLSIILFGSLYFGIHLIQGS
jgi:hypothetical protein